MLQVYYFTSTGWGGTGTISAPTQENTLWGVANVRRCLTLDQAYNACEPTETDPVIITPDPTAFFDELGFPLQTVVVNLGANFTVAAKSITLAGGAYRLRLDGKNNYTFFNNSPSHFIDCEFVNMPSSGIKHRGGFTATRCLFANLVVSTQAVFSDANTFNDCQIIGVRSTYSNLKIFASTSVFNRCTAYGFSNTYTTSTSGTVHTYYNSTFNDSVILYNSTGNKPSEICVVPPPDDCDDVADWSAWESWDFRLKSDSSYASGNALTSADGDVYDLAGNKRKIGGAKGAFEVLDDVTHYSPKYLPWYYSVSKSHPNAPDVEWAAVFPNVATRHAARGFFSNAEGTNCRYKVQTSATSWSEAVYLNDAPGQFGVPVSTNSESAVIAENAFGETMITFSPNASDGWSRCQCGFNNSYGAWSKINGSNTGSSVTQNSVCYIDNNTLYADNASTVKKIYVPGWTHVDLGDVTTTDSLVLGLGATVKSSGNLTLKNETTTSATSGVIDAGGGVLTMQPGATVVIDGGSFSGVLPSKITLANDAAITATGDGAAVVFGADYELPSGSSLALTGGTLTATSATISGTLTLDNVVLSSDITSLTIGGSFFVKQNITVETLVLSNGAEITFEDGSFLSATTTANLGAASVVGYGYLATPHGTDRTSLTTGSDVRLSDYGAGVSDFSAVAATPTTVDLTWSQTDNTATVLIERLVDGVWTVVNSAATSPLTVDTND